MFMLLILHKVYNPILHKKRTSHDENFLIIRINN